MKEIIGDLWEVKSEAIVIPTNGCVNKQGKAIMGKGVAKQAAKRYTSLPLFIGKDLQKKGLRVAAYHVGHWIITFPTKRDWQKPSNTELIMRSAHELVQLTNFVGLFGEETIVLPRVGCGEGGLEWSVVGPIMGDILDDRFVVCSLEA